MDYQSREDIVKYVDYVFVWCNNFIYAIKDGKIDYIAMGKIPKKKNFESRGLLMTAYKQKMIN